MRVEHFDKPTSLREIAEINPKRETAIDLRRGFEEILQQKGKIIRCTPGILGDLLHALWGGNKLLSFTTEISVGEEEQETNELSVLIFRRKQGGVKNPIIVDIGMRLESGEYVRLVLNPKGKAHWISLGRSPLGEGLGGIPAPTARDLELHSEVLAAIQEQS